jgi:4-alpha-glucanotransferase
VPLAIKPLHDLAAALGVHTHYTDGLGRHVTVAPETLVSVCAAVGAAIARPEDAAEALRHHRATQQLATLPPAAAAWEGVLHPLTVSSDSAPSAELRLEDGTLVPLQYTRAGLGTAVKLPWGYHCLTIERPGGVESCTVIAAPERSWRRPDDSKSWGVGAHLAACRSGRSRSVGDLRDLDALVRWVRAHGGDLVTLLPLLPTFNAEPAEPSPYSPVSRLFWSELFLDLGEGHRPSPAPQRLDVTRADTEVRAALAAYEEPEASTLDEELLHYARFRGAQRRMGRNWRDWPGAARSGTLTADQVDGAEERFHLIAQTLARRQLRDVRQRVEREGARLGLDLAVGVHPDGYDPWSRQSLFADGMSVGAPPDAGFPSGQDWGFSPVLPERSRREGHQYIARSIAHQAELAGVLRIDHIMAWTRLYWIPHGFGLHEGTYVSYPADELFAVLTLESHRHRCEIVGENLGTVPREIDEALPRHGIRGMYLAQFEAAKDKAIEAPGARDIALIGTHDTPTLAGWVAGNDIAERVQYGLLSQSAAPREREARAAAVKALAGWLTCDPKEPAQLFAALLERLGGSASSLVIPWIEDLWFEDRAVNLPGTPSSQRPNWQRPMRLLLDELAKDPQVEAMIRCLDRARKAHAHKGREAAEKG